MKENNYTLDVIIATKERANEVRKCVGSLIRQSFLPTNLIIVDASDKNELEERLKKELSNTKIKLKYIKSKPGLTYQRNLGVKNSLSSFVLFLDDDVILNPNYIQEVINVFANDSEIKIGGITGKITNVKRQSLVSKIIRKLFFLAEQKTGEVKNSWANNMIVPDIDTPIKVGWLSGCNQCYRKDVFQTYIFDENLISYSYMEDVDFSYRVSRLYNLFYIPQATLIHNNQAAQSTRLKRREKQKMFMVNLHYLFKKNIPDTPLNKFQHYWSYIGYLLRGLILERNIPFILGTILGIYLNIFNKNYLVNRLK